MQLRHLVVALLAASVSAGKRKKKLAATPTQTAADGLGRTVEKTATPASPTPAAPATNATARGPYCRSGLTGDYAFESCGKFCKEAKAENHCAVRPDHQHQRLPADRLSPASRRAQFCKCHSCGFCKAHYAANKASQPLDSFAAKKKVGGGKKAKKFGGGARLRRKMRGKKKGGAKKEAAPDKP
jgi:hypothetical protein